MGFGQRRLYGCQREDLATEKSTCLATAVCFAAKGPAVGPWSVPETVTPGSAMPNRGGRGLTNMRLRKELLIASGQPHARCFSLPCGLGA